MRRVFLMTLAAALAVSAATACSAEQATPTSPGGDGGAGAFPVTIEHKFGSTTIPERPNRVLSLGYQEHDAIFALGVTPIAVRYWYGDESDVVFPWAEDEAGDADPEILNMPSGELSYEKIAALQPDLVLGLYSGITPREYELLSQIAPTVAQTDEYIDFGVPWQLQTRTVGRALGREQQAADLVAEVEAQFAAVRQAHPEWEGQTTAVAVLAEDGQFSTFASEDPRSRFLTSLGFQVPAEIDELAGDTFYVDVSSERIGLFDTDLLVWDQLQYLPEGRATIEANQLVQQLEASQQGRTIFLEGDLENAFAFNTVLSLPFLLDGVVPMIEAATDGDPATTS